VRLEDAVAHPHEKRRLAGVLHAGAHERTQIEGETDEALLAGLEAFEQRFARVRVAIYDGQRAAFEGQRGDVPESHPSHRAVFSGRFAVDRDAFAFHPRLQDGDQSRTVVSDRDALIDTILKQVAHLGASCGGCDARVLARDNVAKRRGGR